ncbi:DNA primase large subunit-like isoform X2 [Pseudomyrmex gracilis]|uniref:DNA primase large subunit-like isoform X2 n=1 Tax=Pseudomyrmex gracilis TaxID=219809 RepID=UPI0009956745|nr:DNA primase large subunit-like isoform X2 [Pseudomyrmex gracilis]
MRFACYTVLTLVERIHLQKQNVSVSQRKSVLVEMLRQKGLDEFARLISSSGCKSHTDMDLCVRRRDHISHYILRCAVAFDKCKKRWFFKQEARLFKWRFSSLDNEGLRQFMYINNFDFTPISQSEKKDIKEYLEMSSAFINDVNSAQFYKISFCCVPSLIKKRKVLVINGEAFVPQQEMMFAFVPYFKAILISRFEAAREARANLYNDERFTNIFAKLEKIIHIENALLVQDAIVKEYVSLDQLDELSEISYPLCMRVLHKALRKNHHLTHGGRVQYGLFLKGIGISLSDALKFWKNEFTKIMDEAAFKREHIYQIKFLYGTEGGRRDYQPYKCRKIMESVVGPRDCHGCPFKHMPSNTLENELADCGFNAPERSTIMDLTKDGLYSAACTKYYNIKHDCIQDTLIEHPNIYFNESVKHHHLCHDVNPEVEDIR